MHGLQKEERFFTVGNVYEWKNDKMKSDRGFIYDYFMVGGTDPDKWWLSEWYSFEVVKDKKEFKDGDTVTICQLDDIPRANKIVRWTDEITNTIKFKTDFGTVDFTEEQIIFINKFIGMVEDKKTQAVKEFAESIINELLDIGIYNNGKQLKCGDLTSKDIWRIAKKFGVEVEE